MKRALVIGIDDYPDAPLKGCVADALAMQGLLERNGDGSPNFSVRALTSNDGTVDAGVLAEATEELFRADAETVLLYFAGHGIINRETNAGFIVAQDGRKGAWGLALSDLLGMANSAYPKIRSTVIILDSCHSGYAGEVAGLTTAGISVIGTGVTILTASHREGVAVEGTAHGLFTEILIDGLSGGSSDILGNISPASLYAHIDQTLGPWDQRPIYKANVETFVRMRQVSPKIDPQFLRELPKLFPDAAYVYPLDPTYEPERDNTPPEIAAIEPIQEHVRIFKGLQACNRHGLVQPVDAEHMYYAAINSTACRLTAFGAHYRKLAEMDRL